MATTPMFEEWNLQTPDLPARSRLYPLEPVGVGTSYVESLTSYVARLAEAHSVTPGKLVKHEILPQFGRPSLLHNITPFWLNYARALNGVTGWASDLVQVLQTLTRRSDLRFLTMLPWTGVLSAYGLLRHQRAWCPICLEVWQKNGTVVYEPLIWSLVEVTLCPNHGRRLQSACPHCGHMLPWLEADTLLGYCAHCHGWLGDCSYAKDQFCQDEAELKWQQWVAAALGELLAVAPNLPAPPRSDRVAQGLNRWGNHLAGGRLHEFFQILQAHRVQLSKPSLCRWQAAGARPHVRFLLQLCYCLGISPLRFLTADTLVPPMHLNMLEFNEPPLYTRKAPVDLDQLQQALEAMLASHEGPPLSLNQVAKRLGCHGATALAKRLPVQSRVIAERYQVYRNAQMTQRRQRIRAEVQQAAFRLYKQGLYPCLSRVAILLSQPAVVLAPAVRAAWQEALLELGLTS